jgi:hypothetical protein
MGGSPGRAGMEGEGPAIGQLVGPPYPRTPDSRIPRKDQEMRDLSTPRGSDPATL